MSQHKRFPPLKLLSLVFCLSDGKLTHISPNYCFSCMIHIFVIHSLVQLYIYFFPFYLLYRLTYFLLVGVCTCASMEARGQPQVSSQLSPPSSVRQGFLLLPGTYNVTVLVGQRAPESLLFNLFNTSTHQDNQRLYIGGGGPTGDDVSTART